MRNEIMLTDVQKREILIKSSSKEAKTANCNKYEGREEGNNHRKGKRDREIGQ